MQRITIKGIQRESAVIIGASLNILNGILPEAGVFIITDQNVYKFHHKEFPPFPVYRISAGENSKNLNVVSDIYHWLIEHGADRSSYLLGIGGGVVCDIAGFVGSTFMRGIDFGFVATSLLAQVDASVGGKNGVNLNGLKNIIGTINQPGFVLCNVNTLQTLPDEEFVNGMAEVIKHALVADAGMFERLERENLKEIKENTDFLEYIISRSVEIKAEIVQADEKEKGLRRVLNLGHTWGHALEKVAGLPHGKAVGTGLVFEAEFSAARGLLKTEEKTRIVALLEKTGLVVETGADKNKVFEALLSDKKREGDSIYFVFIHGIGKVRVELIPVAEIKKFALK